MRRVSRQGLFLTFLIVASFALFFLDSRGLLNIFHRAVGSLTTPLQHYLFQTRVFVLTPFSFLNLKKEQKDEVSKLRQENTQLKAELGQLASLDEQNERLRKLLGAAPPPRWTFEPARVVSESAGVVWATSSFVPHPQTAVVFAEKNTVLVGVYKESVGNLRKIVLPTNDISKIGVIVRDKETGKRQATGILKAETGKLILEQVEPSETFEEEDLVLTSGDGGLPPDVLVGSVSKVLESTASFKKGEVKYALEGQKLHFVFFVTKF